MRGITPLLLTDLKPGRAVLKIVSDTHYNEQKLQIDRSRSDLFIYTPVMEKHKGRLLVNSTPPGAVVRLDGRELGTTPFAGADILAADYELSLLLAGYLTVKQAITIPPLESLNLSFILEKTYAVTFDPPLPPDACVVCTSGERSLSFKAGDPMCLPAGTWQLDLTGSTFHASEMELTISDQDESVSFQPRFYTPRLVFRNLRPQSSVFFLGEDITAAIAEDVYITTLAEGELLVKTRKFLDFRQYLNVIPDRDTIIDVIYTKDPRPGKVLKQVLGWTILGSGIATTVASSIINSDPVATFLTEDYASYTMLKYITLVTFSGGIILSLVGGVFLVF